MRQNDNYSGHCPDTNTNHHSYPTNPRSLKPPSPEDAPTLTKPLPPHPGAPPDPQAEPEPEDTDPPRPTHQASHRKGAASSRRYDP